MAIGVTTAVKAGLIIKRNWKKIIPICVALLMLPLALFTTSFTIMSTVPAIEQDTIRIYINAASEVGEGKTFISFKDLIAIDAVRLQQNFKKANKKDAINLANKFIQENTKVTNYDLRNYKNTVAILNSELGVSIDWREVAMIDSLLTNEKFSSSSYQITQLAKKFVRINRIPYEEIVKKEVTYEKTIKVWESWFPMMPDHITQKLGWGKWVEETVYETKIVEEVIVKYREGKEVISYDKVLLDLGYNVDRIPEFFKNKSSIKESMQKKIVTYTTKSLDSVMSALGFNFEQKELVKNYRNGLDVLIGGGGGNFNGSGENSPVSNSEFIERVSPGAIDTQKKYGVFASISIAQAILESGWGNSGLTAKANNLFGVKADSSWSGAFVEMETREVYGGAEIIVLAKFRAYESWKHSLEDHGLFLAENSRYAQNGLFKAKDYIGQAYALKQAGYATDPNYPFLLISIIQEYGLYKYDKVK